MPDSSVAAASERASTSSSSNAPASRSTKRVRRFWYCARSSWSVSWRTRASSRASLSEYGTGCECEISIGAGAGPGRGSARRTGVSRGRRATSTTTSTTTSVASTAVIAASAVVTTSCSSRRCVPAPAFRPPLIQLCPKPRARKARALTVVGLRGAFTPFQCGNPGGSKQVLMALITTFAALYAVRYHAAGGWQGLPLPTFFLCRKTLDRLGDQEKTSADCEPACAQGPQGRAGQDEDARPPGLAAASRRLHARLHAHAEEDELGAPQGCARPAHERRRDHRVHPGRGPQPAGALGRARPRRARQGPAGHPLQDHPRGA